MLQFLKPSKDRNVNVVLGIICSEVIENDNNTNSIGSIRLRYRRNEARKTIYKAPDEDYTERLDSRERIGLNELSVFLAEILQEEGISRQSAMDILTKLQKRVQQHSDNSHSWVNLVQHNKISIPDAAPLKWADKKSRPETANLETTDFIKEIYKDYLGKGMTTGTIHSIDPTLYALHLALPKTLRVPTDLLPDGKTIVEARPLPTEEELRAKREKDRAHEREKKARYRARVKARQENQTR